MTLRYFFCLLILVAFSGCSAKNKDPLPQPDRQYKSEALEFQYQADSGLNMYGGQAHTILLGIYQFQDSEGMKRIIQSESGIKKLLQWPGQEDELNKLSLPGCVDTQMVIVNPGEKKTLVLDRAKNAQWIGIVAGYFELDSQNAYRMYEIPVEYVKEGWFFKKKSAVVSNCRIKLSLGPYGIVNMEGETF
ncbi:MAG: type VI secretion lipoprotein TssJ [Desulfohalobiaceae bacterium]|nr:type VI secretion lipoprotein TssJ [Desulfohalobiaceae bacterium]